MKSKKPTADYSHTTFKRSLYETVHRGPLTVEQIAEACNKSTSYVYRSSTPDGTDENDTGIPISVQSWFCILRATGDLRSLDYIEAALGRVAIPLPSVDLATPELSRALLDVCREFGEVAQEASCALQDGKVTRRELEAVEKEALEQIRALLCLTSKMREHVR